MPQRVMLLVNPKARQAQDVGPQVRELLAAAGFAIHDVSAEWAASPAGSNPAEATARVIADNAAEADLIVIAGGDGTISLAADGLMKARLPVGIIPLGTANDLARTLEIPQDLAAACQLVVDGHKRQIDIGQVNGKSFFNVASIGLSVEITKQLTREAKRRWGVFAYLKTAVPASVRARPFKVEIRTPKELIRTHTLQIAVGNGRHYGGGMTVAEEASIDDASLDLYSLEVPHGWYLLRLFPALRKGTLEAARQVRTLRAKNFEISTTRPLAITADGEIVAQTPARFEVLPAALTVFVPGPETAKS